MKLVLVCSAGGHFYELYTLRGVWQRYPHFWATFAQEDTRDLLAEERVYFTYHPTNRHLMNLLRNFALALRLLRRERPDVLISTGAGVSVPFIYAAKLLHIRTIYIESLARITDLSLSGKLVYPIVDRFYVQWPQLAVRYKRAHYAGRVI